MKWTMPSAISGAAHGQVHIPSNEECGIRDVWKHNLEEEFRTIRKVVQKYHYVAMDTEFPGVVARPVGEFRSTADYHYQLLRCNVDLLRIIQLGLTFMDDEGKTPPGYSTWQFNFKFNLSEDMYAQDSIDLLQNSGIQFKKHEEDGIDPIEFAELLMSSGIVLVDNIKWLCFHSGYDFGYLLKLLTDQNLPADEGDFFELLHIYFPNIFDIKYLMKSCKNLKGGLQEVADQLELRRVGPQHQAGSDALLTGMAFFKMREVQHTLAIDLHFDLAAPIVLFPYLLEHTMHVKPSVGRLSLLTPGRSIVEGSGSSPAVSMSVSNGNGIGNGSSSELLTSSSFPVTPPISPNTSSGDDDSSSLGYYFRVMSESLSNSTSDY
ncbi:CCR4-NOT transcription complex subunit 7 isoform X4 [Drosophila ananassae]|uniref:CCR4-NOT transcription complex subunit 7 isoform X4 n=1 Tax=Drosophila ananassae TaxID=7217 RepID=UPI0013A5C72E|nr:CCR4-NOT transcription complex subunit 7 isoform X4 [Drosophila ananassae]